MITKKYNLINNIAGWVVFAVALVTYWLTLEPTASYWDCGEFIIQADKLEVGHPPGNPIFMLTARFFANFASGPEKVALMVNAMSGLLSALTILLLFWTITHLTRRLLTRGGSTRDLSLAKYLVIMGSGVVGALAYTWSDTFWFSAVEGEVYAFSSFCTALVFWLILKWENRADAPHSDRYLILIAYVIGVSVAVHLLNLLCIPAIALVFAYRRFPGLNVWKSLGVLGLSFGIIVLVLYGLVPGFIKVAQVFELFCVNTLHMGFNTGVLIYAVITVGVFVWCLSELYRQRSRRAIIWSCVAAVAVSGMLCFSSSGLVWLLLIGVFALALVWVCRRYGVPVRVLTVAMWSIAVIFVGYSSYALILIRSTADTPMNQNAPDNVFDLASYLSREQYGETPLLYGQTFNADVQKRYYGSQEVQMGPYVVSHPSYGTIVDYGEAVYGKGVKGATAPESHSLSDSENAANLARVERGGDYYVVKGHKPKPRYNPELNMLFPRMYSSMPHHKRGYDVWAPSLSDSSIMASRMVEVTAVDEAGNASVELDVNQTPIPVSADRAIYPAKRVFKPTFMQNLEYFFRYQLNHMYMRYFMWNFAGRQNDILNQGGELDAGNWISGIPALDNARLGDQKLLPDDLGKGNKGHNVFYMLPLLLGIVGLLWQAFAGRRGVEQFWVVFFLFFMTGIAIVLYLNQPPYQPRERDYAFAGSFYAWAIWIGMGVAGLWRLLMWACDASARKGKDQRAAEAADTEADMADRLAGEPARGAVAVWSAVIACLAGLAVPLQMVGQTWDDHDRSGRYAARDYAINYLESTEPNAIIFCNGDNDTFPLWYAQEVEGVRPDVRIINLSYLASDWYAGQLYMQAYESAPLPLTATASDIAYDNMQIALVDTGNDKPMPLTEALKALYAGYGRKEQNYPTFPTSKVYVPIDKDVMVKRGYVSAAEAASLPDSIGIDLKQSPAYRSRGYLSLSDVLMLDIIATNAATGWQRPIYWCSTVGSDYYMGLDPHQASTGLALQLVPQKSGSNKVRLDRFYDVVTGKFRWGGADTAGRKPYYDETAGRMLAGMRNYMILGAQQYYKAGKEASEKGDAAAARADYEKSLRLLTLVAERQPESVLPYGLQLGPDMAELYCGLGDALGRPDLKKTGLALMGRTLVRYAQYVLYQQNIEVSFGRVQLTVESQQIPLRYWGFVELYQRLGGDWKKLKAENPALGRLDEERLQSRWNEVKGYFSGLSDGAVQVEMYASKLVGVKDLDAAAYGALPEDTRYYDSLFYSIILNPSTVGATSADVEEAPSVKLLDMERQKRLYDTYSRAHR